MHDLDEDQPGAEFLTRIPTAMLIPIVIAMPIAYLAWIIFTLSDRGQAGFETWRLALLMVIMIGIGIYPFGKGWVFLAKLLLGEHRIRVAIHKRYYETDLKLKEGVAEYQARKFGSTAAMIYRRQYLWNDFVEKDDATPEENKAARHQNAKEVADHNLDLMLKKHYFFLAMRILHGLKPLFQILSIGRGRSGHDRHKGPTGPKGPGVFRIAFGMVGHLYNRIKAALLPDMPGPGPTITP